MSGHTPGPWTRDMSGHPRPDLVFIPLKSHSCERIGMQVGFVSGCAEIEAQAAANARLIAAAPDLLEALRAFVEHGTCCDDEDMTKARAAIAKAGLDKPA